MRTKGIVLQAGRGSLGIFSELFGLVVVLKIVVTIQIIFQGREQGQHRHLRMKALMVNNNPSTDHESNQEEETPIHRLLQRRKSLGDILGTITNRVNLKRSLIFHESGHLDTPTLANNEVMYSQGNPSSYSGEQATKAESEPLPLLSIQIPKASLDDIDKFTAQMNCMVDGYQIIQAGEPLSRCRGSSSSSSSWKSSSRTLIGSMGKHSGDASTPDANFRSLTPDSYLNLLINGHEDTRYVAADSPSLSLSGGVVVEAIDFLAESRSFSANRRFSLVDKTYLPNNKKSTLFACPEGIHFTPLGHQDQRCTITVCEVDPEYEIEDLDPNFRRRSDVRRKKYQQLTTGLEPQFPNGMSLENSIRMTVARMTRNFHGLSLFEGEVCFDDNEGSEDEEEFSPLEQDEDEVLKAIAIGKQILNKESKYQRMKRMPSSNEICQGMRQMDKFLQETIDLRSPLETRQEISRFLEIPSECVFVDYSASRGLGGPPRQYINKSDAISGLYGASGKISYANFCTYDPRSRTFYPFSPSATVPNLEDLLRNGQEIIWLPVHNGSPVGRKCFQGVLECSVASQEAHPGDPNSEYDVEHGHNSDFQDVDYEDLPDFYDSIPEIIELTQGFPSPLPVIGGAFVPKAACRDTSSKVISDHLPLPIRPDSTVALSLLGPQCCDLSDMPTPEDGGYRLFNECLGLDKDEEILYTLDSDPNAASSKTWFDLAREYLAPQSSNANSSSSSIDMRLNKEVQVLISCDGREDSGLTFGGGFAIPEEGFHSTDISKASRLRRHSSYDIGFGHTDYLLSGSEVKSQVDVEVHEATSSMMPELFPEMVPPMTSTIRPTSSFSYTSYIEAEITAAGLFQRPLNIPTEETKGLHQSSTETHKPKAPSTKAESLDDCLHAESSLDARVISIGSFASGFRFTDYASELPESEMDDETIIRVEEVESSIMGEREAAQDVHEVMYIKQEANEDVPAAQEYISIFGDIEPVDLVRESNNPSLTITTDDLNIRMVGKAARNSFRMERECGKVGGLIDIFQARGLMPQTLKSPIHRSQGPLTQSDSPPSRSTTMGTTLRTAPFVRSQSTNKNMRGFPLHLRSKQSETRYANPVSRPYSGVSDADNETSSVSRHSLERFVKGEGNEKKIRDDRDSDMYG